MSKDKKFKARNRDTDFERKTEADTVLGRQRANSGSQQPDTGKNRRYQVFSENMKPYEASTADDNSAYDNRYGSYDDTDGQRQDEYNQSAEQAQYNPQSVQTEYAPQGLQRDTHSQRQSYNQQHRPHEQHKNTVPDIVKHRTRKKHYHQNYAQQQESVSHDNSNTEPTPHEPTAAEPERAADTTVTEPPRASEPTVKQPQTEPTYADAEPSQMKPMPHKENDKYNFQDAAHTSDKAFDRTDGKSDFQLGRDIKNADERTAPANSKRDLQRKQIRKSAPQNKEYSFTEAVRQSDKAFEITNDKKDFQLGNKTEAISLKNISDKSKPKKQKPYTDKYAEQENPDTVTESDNYSFTDTVQHNDKAFDRVDGRQDFQLGNKPEAASAKQKAYDKKSQDKKRYISDKSTDQEDSGTVTESGNYSFTDTVQHTDEAFDRADGKSDFMLGRQDKNISAEHKPSDKKHQAQKKRVKEDKSGKYNIKEAVSDSDTAFERTEPKEDFSFQKDKDYALHRDNKTELPQNTDYKFEREQYRNSDKKDGGEKRDTKTADNKRSGNKDTNNKQRDTKTEPKQSDSKSSNGKEQQKKKQRRSYDEAQKKPKNRLKFEDDKKSMPKPIAAGAGMAGAAASYRVHSKISESEDENVAVKAAHSTERGAERLIKSGNNTRRSLSDKISSAKNGRRQRLKFEHDRSEGSKAADTVKSSDKKSKAEIKKKHRKKAEQQKLIKKNYQKQKNAEKQLQRAKKIKEKAKEASAAAVEFVKRNWKVLIIVLAAVIIFGFTASTISSCAVMVTSGLEGMMTSTYLSEDEDINNAENYYKSLEADLQSEIDNIERDYSWYDEYNYSLAQIGHNPYELVSYLSAAYIDFTFDDIKPELDALFSQQYQLTLTEDTQIRYDYEGRPYYYRILNITLVNNNLNSLANTYLDDEQKELYAIYLESKGNRDDLFADDIYANAADAPSYTIPGEALSDATFRRLITEAERYLGYPYVWGGSSPSTSFDCSGFVCWVFQNSGVYPLSRTTAQGIYNQCAVIPRSQAKPGDIIFFTGTYNAGEPVTHVGIYVGDGMMIHCGNPIQYASVDSSYWTQHFYAFGRLGG